MQMIRKGREAVPSQLGPLTRSVAESGSRSKIESYYRALLLLNPPTRVLLPLVVTASPLFLYDDVIITSNSRRLLAPVGNRAVQCEGTYKRNKSQEQHRRILPMIRI